MGTLVNATAQLVMNGSVNFPDALAAGTATGAVNAAIAVNPALAASSETLAVIGGTAATAGSVIGDVVNGRDIDAGKALAAGIGGTIGTPTGSVLLSGTSSTAAGAVLGEAITATVLTSVPAIVGAANNAIDTAKQAFSTSIQKLEDFTRRAACPRPDVEGACN